MNDITIDLDIREGRTLFEALAELPFKRVYELIGKINKTANKNLAVDADENDLASFDFTARELEVAIEALGELPFKRAHPILEKIHYKLNITEN